VGGGGEGAGGEGAFQGPFLGSAGDPAPEARVRTSAATGTLVRRVSGFTRALRRARACVGFARALWRARGALARAFAPRSRARALACVRARGCVRLCACERARASGARAGA